MSRCSDWPFAVATDTGAVLRKSVNGICGLMKLLEAPESIKMRAESEVVETELSALTSAEGVGNDFLCDRDVNEASNVEMR